jgi:L-threonylcarbamoyladenylate synthase
VPRPPGCNSGPLPSLADSSLIAAAAARLREGGLVAFPTETVYGLGADALNPAAVALVFALKGRPAINPLIVHVLDEATARPLVADWPEDAAILAEAFWPGPLTMVLPRSPAVPAIVNSGGASVALRCPDHPIALELLRVFGGPLVGPSANPSGRVSPTTAEHVRGTFPADEVLVLDGGPCRTGIESTVLILPCGRGRGQKPQVLRRGVISAAQISRLLGREVLDAATEPGPQAAGPLPSPGLLPLHYAPQTPLRLFGAGQWPAVLDSAKAPVVISHRPRVPGGDHPGATLIHMPAQPEAYAARLYAALREADARQPAPDLILAEEVPSDHPVWLAIADRLSRAAGPKAAS